MCREYLLLMLVACLFVFACEGCKKDGDTIILVAGNQAPEIAAVADQQATKGFLFNLDLSSYVTDDSDPVASLTFLIISGGGSFTGAIYENTFNATGQVTVQFLVLDTDNLPTIGSFNVNVLSPPSGDFIADATYGPATLSVNFTDQSTGDIDTWAWDFGDTGTSTEQDPSHNYTAPGWYTVSLAVTGPGGTHTRTKHSYIQVLGATADTWYVDSANTAATVHDGLAWDTAFLEIDSGITAATHGDRVLVADGTYTGTSNTNLDFNGRLIYVGSYDLHGSGACIIDCEGLGLAFLFSSGETNDAVLDGLIMVNGDYMGGAGITFSNASSPTIVNCTFTDCNAAMGAGIYISGGSLPIISNCVFSDNTVSMNGGAIYIAQNSGAEIIHCTMTNNYSSINGGAIYATASLGITIDDSIIENNTCINYGGGIYSYISPTTITGCSISENSADTYGGGIGFHQSTIIVQNSHVDRNEAGSQGGGIYADDSTFTLVMTDCSVDDNLANGWGGGIYASNTNVTLTDCSVSGNEALASEANGAGMYANNCELALTGCTLSNNRLISIDDPCKGGALRTIATNATLVDCTIYGNSAESFGGSVEGGGLYFMAMGEVNASLTNCTITSNKATGYGDAYGGGISISGLPSVIENCTVSGNTAFAFCDYDHGDARGGGIKTQYEPATILGCTISGNKAECYSTAGAGSSRGGGINVDNSSWINITGCTITGNAAQGGGDGTHGGGINADEVLLTIENCIITGNSAIIPGITSPNNDDGGGGIYLDFLDADISNCLIAGNYTNFYGGGIYSYSTAFPVFTNCTVADNIADIAGGGAFLNSSTAYATAYNTIFWSNTAENGNEVYVNDTFAMHFVNSDYSNATGDVEGGGSLTDDGVNTIYSNPLFAASTSGSYYLSNTLAGQAADSPCIDGGNDTAVNLGLDAKTTRTDGVTDSGTVDMGWHYKP